MLSLGLAIALSTTMYSVIDALVNPKLDMRDHHRLFRIAFYGDMRRIIPQEDKDDALTRLPFVEGLATQWWTLAGYAERGTMSRPVRGVSVSPNYFATVGVQPLYGRLLSDVDTDVAPAPVVVSEVLWKQFFAGRAWFDSATIILNGVRHPIVGVLGYFADFPGDFTDVWQIPPRAQLRVLQKTILRVKPGWSDAQVYTMLQTLAQRLGARAGEGSRDVAYRMKPAIGDPFRYRQFHFALIGAVAAVMLIACVNMANLQLARGITRSRELATRAAVGATRGQLVRQLVVESAWLTFGGLALAAVLTWWGTRFISASVPPSLADFIVRPHVSWRLFAFAGLATMVALAIVGLLPALRLSRVDISDVLKAGAGTGSSRRARRQYGALVVVQVGFALSVLIAAVLLIRTAVTVFRVAVNPTYERLIYGYAQIRSRTAADSAERLTDVSTRVVREARAVPTVVEAATTRHARPMERAIAISDESGVPKEVGTGLWGYALASPSIVRTLAGQITKGRDFTEGEFAEPLAIVDEGTAVYLWPGRDPVGRQIKLGSARSPARWVRVVGVARMPREWFGLNTTPEAERLTPRLGAVYVLESVDSARAGGRAGLQLVVRGSTDVPRLPALLRRAFAPLAARVGIARFFTFDERHGLTRLRERQSFVATLFTVFAAIAVATAALGVYAVVSHSVSTRTREFGVRIALGATVRQIRQAVFFEGNVLALLGIVLGLLITAATSKWLVSFLMGEEEIYESWLFGLAALLFFGIALLASWIPARRAMRIDALEALRND